MKRRKIFSLAGSLFLCVAGIYAENNERGIDLYRAELYNAAKIFFTQQQNQSQIEQAENYYYLGQTYYELQQSDSAAYFYNKAVETDANYPFGYIGQGKIALDKNDKKEAENLFKKAIGLAKKNPLIQTSIAEVYIAAKMYPQMEETLDKARKINVKFPGIYIAEGDMLMQENKVGEACSRYDMAISFDKKYKEAYLKSARVYKTINPKEALRYLNELIEIDPNYIPAYAELGDIYRADGKYLQALDAYKKFISISGVPILQHERYAQLLYFTDNFAESLKQISFVLQHDPENPVMHRLEAYNNFKLENYASAVEQLKNFLEVNPEKDHIYLDYITYGRALVKNKQANLAVEAFIKASQSKDSKSEVYRELASAYELLNNYTEAVATYEKFFEVEPTPVVFDFYYYGMDNYYAAGKYFSADYKAAKRTPEEQAEDDLKMKSFVEKGSVALTEVINRSPESYMGYFWKGRINALLDALQQERTKQTDGVAKPFYEEALTIMLTKNEDGSLNKDIMEIYRYLGSYYYLLFEKEKTNKEAAAKAREYYQKILEIEPENAGAKAVLDVLKNK
ncbi:MAG: hypothetical protein LBH32_03150 [Dysgonamonadaceae bacterium]|nr:hypothetical protein [Dysgonamonadaceae bacterium]